MSCCWAPYVLLSAAAAWARCSRASISTTTTTAWRSRSCCRPGRRSQCPGHVPQGSPGADKSSPPGGGAVPGADPGAQLGVLYIVMEFIDGAAADRRAGPACSPPPGTCAADAPAGGGPAGRARAGRRPPRHLAGQYPAGRRAAGPSQDHRFRHRQGPRRRARRRSSATASPASSAMWRPNSSATSAARSVRGPTSTAWRW